MTDLTKVLAIYKTQTALAEALGVHKMTVSSWKSRGIPAKRAMQIERMTKGRIKASELLPD